MDIETLSPSQRLELIEHLWDSLSEGDLRVSDELEAELDRRLDDLERNPNDAEQWEEVRDRLLRRLT